MSDSIREGAATTPPDQTSRINNLTKSEDEINGELLTARLPDSQFRKVLFKDGIDPNIKRIKKRKISPKIQKEQAKLF